MTTFLRTLPRRLPMLLLAAAVVGAAAQAPLRAAQDKKFKILFGDKAEDAAPRASVLVRPTVLQKIFVYVQNTTPNDDEATVEVWAGGAPLEGRRRRSR